MNFFYQSILLLILSLIIFQLDAQIVPIYDYTDYFYADGGSASITSSIGTFPKTFPTGFQISTAIFRKPFVIFSQVEDFTIDDKQGFYFLTEIISFSSTSFALKISNKQINLSPIIYYGLMPNRLVKYRYMIVRNTFPDLYLCKDIQKQNFNIIGATTNLLSFSLINQTGMDPPPFNISTGNVGFFYAWSYLDANTTQNNLKGQFQMYIWYSVVNSTHFDIKIDGNYSMNVKRFNLMVFMYNTLDFDSLIIKFDRVMMNFYTVSPISTSSTPLTTSYQAKNTSIVYGLMDLQIFDVTNIGFKTWIDQPLSGNTFYFNLDALYSTVKRYTVMAIIPVQLRCPNFQPLIKEITFDQCFTSSCPSNYFNSMTNISLLSNISVCKKCISTCKQCINMNSTCLSCYATQFRELVNNTCSPVSHYYDNGSDITQPCNSNCAECVTTAITCTKCHNSTFYLDTVTNTCKFCTLFSIFCLTCNSSSCITCQTDYFVYLGGCGNCTSVYGSLCLQCDDITCTNCSTDSFFNGTHCQPCSSYSIQCLQCDSFGCLDCSTDLIVYLTECDTCANIFGPLCYDCDSFMCTNCSIDSFFNGSQCQIICQTKYDFFCATCDINSCLTCINGYFYNVTTQLCQTTICGDGVWQIEGSQFCDDGNLLPNDGCSPNCQVQPDYICDPADKLPSGLSFCKYNKNVTIKLSYIQQEQTSNTVHVYFNLQPSHLQQWDLTTIQSLITPITIYSSDGTSTVVPTDQISYNFYKNQQTNQIQIIIDYSKFSLEGAILEINVQPDQTSISTIQHLPGSNNLFKLESGENGVYLYNYPPEIYEMQKTINTLSQAVGLIAMAFIFLGMFVPVGKLIVLQALAVAQISYFSIFQLQKIPPTFIGLKNLVYSNGYNSQNLLSENNQIFKGDTSTLMGISPLNPILFSNYNISLVILFLMPFLFGFVGYIVSKFMCKSEKKYEIQEKQKIIKLPKQYLKTLFLCILLQSGFYGLLICGYFAWICICISINNSLTNSILPLMTELAFWVAYAVLIFKSQTKGLNLIKMQKKSGNPLLCKRKSNIRTDNETISTGFGQFQQVFSQISQSKEKNYQKIYILFMTQRIIFSALIVFVPQIFDYTCIITIFLYSMILVGLNILNYKASDSSNPKKSMFSFLHKNYTLRQSFNLISIISVQGVIFSFIFSVQESDQFSAFVTNSYTTTMVPLIMLSILTINLISNIFFYVWQVKSSQIITKAKQLYRLFFPQKLDLQQIDLKKQDPSKQLKRQQEQFNNMLNSFVQTSPIFKQRKSPFLGMQQVSVRKDSFINLLNIQEQLNNQVLNLPYKIPDLQMYQDI